MKFMLGFAGVAGAIGLSIAFALCVEYASLRGLLRLMPARLRDQPLLQRERNETTGRRARRREAV